MTCLAPRRQFTLTEGLIRPMARLTSTSGLVVTLVPLEHIENRNW